MTESTLTCPDCATEYAPTDNYCRECGMYVAALRSLPVIRNAAPVAIQPRQRAQLPAPVRRAVTAVAVGAALQMGVGLAGKYLAAQAGKKALDAALQSRPRKRPQRSPARAAQTNPQPDPMADVSVVSETVMVQRTWLRRP